MGKSFSLSDRSIRFIDFKSFVNFCLLLFFLQYPGDHFSPVYNINVIIGSHGSTFLTWYGERTKKQICYIPTVICPLYRQYVTTVNSYLVVQLPRNLPNANLKYTSPLGSHNYVNVNILGIHLNYCLQNSGYTILRLQTFKFTLRPNSLYWCGSRIVQMVLFRDI